MALVPAECSDSGGGGGDAIDVEDVLLCDVLPDGTVAGSAIAVYQYDEAGAPVGPPTLVIPGTNDPYVPQGVMRPCETAPGSVSEFILCDVQENNTSIQFVRKFTQDSSGVVLQVDNLTLEGAVYAPTGTVTDCDPYTTCEPLSDVNLNGTCGPGEPVNNDVVSEEGVSADSVITDDPTADALCDGVWDRPSQPSPFEVEESFRNATFDQPGPVTQGTAPYAGLTASPGFTGSNVDTPGDGWLQTSDINSGTNGMWQVPDPFSAADGMTARVTWASHDGTVPNNGDGMAFVFTNGGVPPQSTAIGGFGNLGLNNWEGGYVAVVLDEYGQTCTCSHDDPSSPNPGPCGWCGNSISIQLAGDARAAASCACCTLATVNVAPKSLSSSTTRENPAQLITSIIEEGGRTFVSASILWPGDTDPIVYFNRVDVTDCAGPAPASLRMALYGGSGGGLRSEHEYRDAVATAAGIQDWRAFPIVTDPIDPCVTSVRVEACVDITFVEDTQPVGNGNSEAFLWMVNAATGQVYDKAQRSSQPSQVGETNNMCVDTTVPVAELPNLRVYVGAETRDPTGVYGSSWENFEITVAGLGCPVTPVRTLAISAPCPIDVNIIGGTADGTPAPVTVVNTPATFEDAVVCITTDGEPFSGFRREVQSADGSVTVVFLGVDGVPVTPTSWEAGACKEANQTLGPVCYASVPPLGSPQTGFMTLDGNGVPVLYDAQGEVVPEGEYTVVICVEQGRDSHVLCDFGNNGQAFVRGYQFSPVVGDSFTYAAEDLDLDGNPYVVVGPVGVCDGGSIAEFVLCDAFTVGPNDVRISFVRKFFQDPNGVVLSVVDLTVNGDPYVVQGVVGVCDQTNPTQFDTESICYTLTATGATLHSGWARHQDDIPPSPQNPAGILFFDADGTPLDFSAGGFTVVPCVSGTVTVQQIDTEVLVLCDANGTRFLRRYVYDEETPGGATITNTTLDGSTAFVPVGAVGVCTTTVATDFDFAEEILCDANGTTFIRRFRFNSQTGLLDTTTNLTLAGAAFVPVGAVGLCTTCCPIEIGEGCYTGGSGRYTALRLPTGVISLIDSVTGAAVLAADIVPCASDDTARTLTAQGRLVGDADAAWTPGADVVGVLTSVTLTVLSGTATVTDSNGTVMAGLPAGYTATWTSEDDNTLTGPQSIDAVGGNTAVIWTQR